ncbi:hypothetical protein V7157_10775 [Neobacillus drentensis]|uniref:hypothetical protein n=1 Tax=Neobacillus drentensis TaxID=220684 RepID=UPI002FFF90EE
MEDRKTRLIYEYFNVEQKKKALILVQEDKKQLEKELNGNFDNYPKIVQRVLSDTLERWQIEIEELTYDINNNIGPIRPGPFS